MKVLSIKEPYASLIANGDKHIETRSWKTKYRGELFIHASKKKETILRPYVKDITKDLDVNCGYILCKANLVDCIYMDEAFMEEIKKHDKEYRLGLYEIGRYAWVLEDIELIEPIEAKGQLNIWNYNGNYESQKKEEH